MKKTLSYIFLIISLAYLSFVILSHRALYIKKYDAKKEELKFYSSQWSIPNSKHQISDEELYAYSGYRLIHGGNPIFVNPEAPPLGKYFIGLSILLFQNEKVISVIMAFFSLILIYQLTFHLSKSRLAASIAIFLTSINSLFIDQILHAPQLEIQQLTFLLLLIYLLILFQKKKMLLFSIPIGITMGLFLSIKVFILSYVLINAWLILTFLPTIRKKVTIFTLIITNIISLAAFSGTYFSYFLHGNSVRDFLGVQKWIYTFYSNSHIQMTKLIGNYLTLLFFNKWRFWSEGYPVIQYQSWSFIWPVTFLVGCFVIYQIVKEKSRFHSPYWPVVTFFAIYNAFLFVVPIFPRYLLLLLVPLTILIGVYFDKIIHNE